MKKVLNIVTMMLVSLFAVSLANAAITITEVEFDDSQLTPRGTNPADVFEKGEEYEVKVRLVSDVDVDDVEIEAELAGHDRDDRITDVSDVFDMKANRTYTKRLHLNFPTRAEADVYTLGVEVESRAGSETEEQYTLEIEPAKNLLAIDDVIFNPESQVRAGRALLTTVRVENFGLKDEDGVKVRVSIPELGVSASDFIDEIEKEGKDDDEVSSEELFIRIPDAAETGTYDVEITVEFKDGDRQVSATRSIQVVQDGLKAMPEPERGQIVISAGASQDVVAGQGGAVFPVTLTNNGQASRTFTLGVSGVEGFGTSRVSPSNVLVLGPGETQSVFVSVSANEDASEGAHQFSVSISADGATLKNVPLTANVVGSDEDGDGLQNVRKGLEIGLIVLVILLVILGLIIGLSRLRGDEEGEETYY